jgi:hypothetical protein
MLLNDALAPKTPPNMRAQVACAWEKLEERKRILKMKPKPRDLDTTKVEKRGRKVALPGPAEPGSRAEAAAVSDGPSAPQCCQSPATAAGQPSDAGRRAEPDGPTEPK